MCQQLSYLAIIPGWKNSQGQLGWVLLLFIAKQSMSLNTAQAGWSVRPMFGSVTLPGYEAMRIWLLRHVVLIESVLKISRFVVSLALQPSHVYTSTLNNIALD